MTIPTPPPGFNTWLEYSWSHQHTNGAQPCWQCNAIKNARAELATNPTVALLDQIKELKKEIRYLENRVDDLKSLQCDHGV